jgi:hypothetical protein
MTNAGDGDAGVRLTPFYVKSGLPGQLRQRDCSNASAASRLDPGVRRDK